MKNLPSALVFLCASAFLTLLSANELFAGQILAADSFKRADDEKNLGATEEGFIVWAPLATENAKPELSAQPAIKNKALVMTSKGAGTPDDPADDSGVGIQGAFLSSDFGDFKMTFDLSIQQEPRTGDCWFAVTWKRLRIDHSAAGGCMFLVRPKGGWVFFEGEKVVAQGEIPGFDGTGKFEIISANKKNTVKLGDEVLFSVEEEEVLDQTGYVGFLSLFQDSDVQSVFERTIKDLVVSEP